MIQVKYTPTHTHTLSIKRHKYCLFPLGDSFLLYARYMIRLIFNSRSLSVARNISIFLNMTFFDIVFGFFFSSFPFICLQHSMIVSVIRVPFRQYDSQHITKFTIIVSIALTPIGIIYIRLHRLQTIFFHFICPFFFTISASSNTTLRMSYFVYFVYSVLTDQNGPK